MARPRPFRILYAPVVSEHLRVIPRKHHGLIKEAIEVHLAGEPDRETTSRRLLSPTTELEAEWELRSGPKNMYRVFYNIDATLRIVLIVAIGVKRGNRLKIGRDEVML